MRKRWSGSLPKSDQLQFLKCDESLGSNTCPCRKPIKHISIDTWTQFSRKQTFWAFCPSSGQNPPLRASVHVIQIDLWHLVWGLSVLKVKIHTCDFVEFFINFYFIYLIFCFTEVALRLQNSTLTVSYTVYPAVLTHQWSCMINVIKNSDHHYNNWNIQDILQTFLPNSVCFFFFEGWCMFGNFETSARILNEVKWHSLRINFHGALNFEHCPLKSKLPLFPSSQQPFMWTGC